MGLAATAFAGHCRAWNDRDFGAWVRLFADAVVFEDPVGGVFKRGHAALATTWERSQSADRRWLLEPRRVIECGQEVAVDLVNTGSLGGDTRIVESIEIWRVDEAGLVVSVRSFFDPDPAVHDRYYLPAEQRATD